VIGCGSPRGDAGGDANGFSLLGGDANILRCSAQLIHTKVNTKVVFFFFFFDGIGV
jgi:hypothetical protein